MKLIKLTFCSILLSISLGLHAQTSGSQNYAFQPDEKVTYSVFYTVMGMYVNAGTATLTTSMEKLDNTDVYHVVGEGKTNPKYDWMFKVRDRYESYFHADNLTPLKFVREVSEGNYKKNEYVTFNKQENTARTSSGVMNVPDNVQDVISILYFARNIDYNQYKKGDKIPFNMFLDNKVYNIYVIYLGKENIRTKYGKFKAIKLKPLLVKGNVFDDEGKMTVWVTDDSNHIPVRAESPVSVGSIKVDLTQFENLRYPLAILR